MSTSSRFAVAVHILTMMAWAEDEPVKSEIAAGSVNTNPVVIRRILCSLARAQLVISQAGAAGGSRLARKPSLITLLDVYRAVEPGQVFLLHQRRPNRHCPVGTGIQTVLQSILQDVNSAVEEVLSNMTVADVVARIESCKRNRSRVASRA